MKKAADCGKKHRGDLRKEGGTVHNDKILKNLQKPLYNFSEIKYNTRINLKTERK